MFDFVILHCFVVLSRKKKMAHQALLQRQHRNRFNALRYRETGFGGTRSGHQLFQPSPKDQGSTKNLSRYQIFRPYLQRSDFWIGNKQYAKVNKQPYSFVFKACPSGWERDPPEIRVIYDAFVVTDRSEFYVGNEKANLSLLQP